MLTTFDESYDGDHNFLILGALFIPSHKVIHKDFVKLKRDAGYVDRNGQVREIKYTLCSDSSKYDIAKSTIDLFASSPSFFRAIVVDQRPGSGYDLKYFGRHNEPQALKEARAYKKFTEILLRSNIPSIQPNGLLYTDRLTRCKGDQFCQLITELFGTTGENYSTRLPKPVFKHVIEVDTSLEQYHLGQIGDILQGVILNELKPGGNRWKKKIRNYVKRKLGLPSLLPDYWQVLPKYLANAKHDKYQVWYWSPGKE